MNKTVSFPKKKKKLKEKNLLVLISLACFTTILCAVHLQCTSITECRVCQFGAIVSISDNQFHKFFVFYCMLSVFSFHDMCRGCLFMMVDKELMFAGKNGLQ